MTGTGKKWQESRRGYVLTDDQRELIERLIWHRYPSVDEAIEGVGRPRWIRNVLSKAYAEPLEKKKMHELARRLGTTWEAIRDGSARQLLLTQCGVGPAREVKSVGEMIDQLLSPERRLHIPLGLVERATTEEVAGVKEKDRELAAQTLRPQATLAHREGYYFEAYAGHLLAAKLHKVSRNPNAAFNSLLDCLTCLRFVGNNQGIKNTISLIEEMLNETDDLPKPLIGRLTSELGMLQFDCRDSDGGYRLFTRSDGIFDAYRRANARSGNADGARSMQLYNSRRIQHIEGERDLNAVSRLLTTFKEFEVNTDLRGLCNTMISIVNTYARHNRFAKGLEFLEEKSLEISDGSKWHEAMSQAMKGYLLRKLGKSDAEEPLCESLKTMHAFDMCPPLSPEGTGWLALRPDLVLGDDHPQVKALGHVREFDVFPLTRDELKRIEHRASALIL